MDHERYNPVEDDKELKKLYEMILENQLRKKQYKAQEKARRRQQPLARRIEEGVRFLAKVSAEFWTAVGLYLLVFGGIALVMILIGLMWGQHH
jgi:hypothetical protein